MSNDLRNLRAALQIMLARDAAFQQDPSSPWAGELSSDPASSAFLASDDHRAWNPELAFEQRIALVPLRFLELNIAQRPPVCFQAPFRSEMVAIAETARQLGANATICDACCGNGFLGSLLSEEGLRVFGVDDRSGRGGQDHITRPWINSFQHASYRTLEAAIEDVSEPFDVAYSSWPPQGLNISAVLANTCAQIMILVLDLMPGSDGAPVTGTAECYVPPRGWQRLAYWAAIRPAGYFDAQTAPATRSADGHARLVSVYVRDGVAGIAPHLPASSDDTYPWDRDRLLLNEFARATGEPEYRVHSLPPCASDSVGWEQLHLAPPERR